MSEGDEQKDPSVIEASKSVEQVQQYDNIFLTRPFTVISAHKLRKKVPVSDDTWIYGCDFALKRDDSGEEIRSSGGVLIGYRFKNFKTVNIDHHLRIPEMARVVSSANLAILLVEDQGVIPKRDFVVINHSDTDSILSALILTGKIPPQEQFGQAAIAVDHTGERNPIGDLINAVSSKEDLTFSIHCLQSLLKGEPLSEEALDLLEERKAEREAVEKFVKEGRLEHVEKGVYFGRFEGSVRSEFLPAIVPGATVFVLATSLAKKDLWDVKVRAGKSFPGGMNLQSFNLPEWTGRWNAGGTIRQGGWRGENPREYAQLVVEKFKENQNALAS